MDPSPPVKPAAAGVDRSLVIRNLRKEYRAGQPVLKDISLAVEGRGMTASAWCSRSTIWSSGCR
jgi:hypothetical protein